MASGSRIESETARRVVIALVMSCVLALSMGLAMLRAGNSGNEAGHTLKMARQELRIFSIERPASWQAREVGSNGLSVGYGMVFEAPANGRQRLLAVELELPQPTPPEAAARRLLAQLGSPSTYTEVQQQFRQGPFAVSVLVHDRLVLAVMTIDGRKYLGLGVTFNPVNGQIDHSLSLLQRVIESARDERFKSLTTPLHLPSGVSLNVPPSLGVLGYAHLETLAHVVFYPRDGRGFYALHLAPLDLTPPPDEPHATPPQNPIELDWLELFFEEAKAPDRLAEVLFARFFRATGRWPTTRDVKTTTLRGRPVYKLSLAGTRGSGMDEELWGVWTSPQHAVVIELVTDPDLRNPAVNAAGALVRELVGADEEPDAK